MDDYYLLSSHIPDLSHIQPVSLVTFETYLCQISIENAPFTD